MEKKVTLPNAFSAIFTNEKNKHSYIFNFSESGDFSVTKFTLQFLWILQFLKISKIYLGKGILWPRLFNKVEGKFKNMQN